MTFPEFDAFQLALLEQVKAMATSKGKEYANGEDRFGNFNLLATRLGLTREQVLWVYLVKHLDGIESFIMTRTIHSNEPIQGRIVDAITYLTILAGMLEPSKKET